jgi:hypothetical protein
LFKTVKEQTFCLETPYFSITQNLLIFSLYQAKGKLFICKQLNIFHDSKHTQARFWVNNWQKVGG